MYRWKKRMQNENRHDGRSNRNFRLPQIFGNTSNVQTSPLDSNYSITSDCLMAPAAKCIGNIGISSRKLEEINEILKKLEPIARVGYDSLENSAFKMNFLEKRLVTIEQKMDFFSEKLVQNENIDYCLFQENNSRCENSTFIELYSKRKNLPSFLKRNQILKMINDHQVVLISGETGCGKTTQVPQFLLDDYMSRYQGSICKIICTQPRRISAVSVAQRVAKERGEELGVSVGYQIRLERVLPRKYGSILFVTNGVVIRLMESDPSLKFISHLIIDEIHERDIHSDFLLTLVKQLIIRRKDLKVILMSATLNEKRFEEYFSNCAHIHIGGSSHNVQEYFLEDVVERLNYSFNLSITRTDSMERNTHMFNTRVVPYVRKIMEEGQYPGQVCRQLLLPQSEEINIDLIFNLTMDICRKEPPGGILIFVTGYDDINNLFNRFYSLSEDEYRVIPLHSEIPMEDQKYVFEPAPRGVRKIVISTNIAETSITIDDIVYVIDSGWAKTKVFDPKTNTENLRPLFISKANAVQRKGRAGRLMAGKCFRLYTRGRFGCFYEFQRPEILRCRLESLMLQMKFLQLGKVRSFFDKMLDKPDSERIEASLNLLNELGALDEDEALSPLGYYLAKLPIAPQLGKMLLLGVIFNCLEPILNIVVSLDYKKPFNLNLKRNTGKPRPDPKIIEFSENVKSDHLLLHKALHVYKTLDKSERPEFCAEYGINTSVVQMLKKMKKEFMEYLYDLELVATTDLYHSNLNSNSKNVELLKSVIFAGLYPNVIIANRLIKTSFSTLNGNVVALHPKSSLYGECFFSSPLLAFYIKLKSRMDMVHDVTMCSPYPAIIFANDIQVEKTMKSHYLVVNKKMRFACEKHVSPIVVQLKDRIAQYITHRLVAPTSMIATGEKQFLKIIIDLLASQQSSVTLT